MLGMISHRIWWSERSGDAGASSSEPASSRMAPAQEAAEGGAGPERLPSVNMDAADAKDVSPKQDLLSAQASAQCSPSHASQASSEVRSAGQSLVQDRDRMNIYQKGRIMKLSIVL